METNEIHPELVAESLAIVPEPQKQAATAMIATVEQGVADALAIEVTDDLTFAQAGEALRAIKSVAKKLEATRTAMKKPVLEAGKQIDGFFRVPSGRLMEAEHALKKRIAAYQAEQERKRREAEEAARRERERLERERQERERAERERAAAAEEAARLATEAAPMEDAPIFEAPEPPAPEPIPEPVVIPEVARLKGVSTRTIVKARAVSLAEVVRAAAAGHQDALAILAIDQGALNALVRAKGSTLSVPGVEVFEETVVSARGAS